MEPGATVQKCRSLECDKNIPNLLKALTSPGWSTSLRSSFRRWPTPAAAWRSPWSTTEGAIEGVARDYVAVPKQVEELGKRRAEYKE